MGGALWLWYWRSPLMWRCRWLHLFLGIVWRRYETWRIDVRTAAKIATIVHERPM
jgi:hypothetical protein